MYNEIELNDLSKNTNNENITNEELLINDDEEEPELSNSINNEKESENKLDSKNSESSKYYFYKKLGNTFSFFGNKYGDPLIIIGPEWYMYIIFNVLLAGLYSFIYIHFGNFLNSNSKILGIVFFSIFYLSYTYTFLINPGYPKNNIKLRNKGRKKKVHYCQICKRYVNKKITSHCIKCDICIEEFDHHCIWTSKCIGRGNINSFNIFVIFTFLTLAYAMIIIFIVEHKFMKYKESI